MIIVIVVAVIVIIAAKISFSVFGVFVKSNH